MDKPQKIVSYKPGPVADPPAEPPPYTIPRMGTSTPVVPRTVWRVQEADLPELGTWLVDRLQKTWPQLDPNGLAMWLRACFQERSALLVRSREICGLFLAETTALDPRPIVRERWVRTKDKETPNEQAVALYRFAKNWAASIGALEFSINHDSDAPMVHVHGTLSDVKKNHIVRKSSLYTVLLTE